LLFHLINCIFFDILIIFRIIVNVITPRVISNEKYEQNRVSLIIVHCTGTKHVIRFWKRIPSYQRGSVSNFHEWEY